MNEERKMSFETFLWYIIYKLISYFRLVCEEWPELLRITWQSCLRCMANSQNDFKSSKKNFKEKKFLQNYVLHDSFK